LAMMTTAMSNRMTAHGARKRNTDNNGYRTTGESLIALYRLIITMTQDACIYTECIYTRNTVKYDKSSKFSSNDTATLQDYGRTLYTKCVYNLKKVWLID
jgi:outer membrane cobalamin receptor